MAMGLVKGIYVPSIPLRYASGSPEIVFNLIEVLPSGNFLVGVELFQGKLGEILFRIFQSSVVLGTQMLSDDTYREAY